MAKCLPSKCHRAKKEPPTKAAGISELAVAAVGPFSILSGSQSGNILPLTTKDESATAVVSATASK